MALADPMVMNSERAKQNWSVVSMVIPFNVVAEHSINRQAVPKAEK
jgi:hypothetical protein